MPRHDMPDTGAKPGPEGSPLQDKKLVSWKEIATYLGREVRTVQRWEETEGLPVHRHEHLKKSTVYAYASELDAWFKKRQPVDDPEADAAFVPESDVADPDNGAESAGPAAITIDQPDLSLHSPSPPVDPVKPPPPDRRGLAIMLASAAILCLFGYGAYRLWLKTHILSPDEIRLVVLPLANLSGDPKKDYLSAGLTDVITTQLGRLDPKHIRVIAPTSAKVMSGKPIAEIRQTLNVQYILEGSVQPVANQVRIDIRLIQASDEVQAGSDSFTRELSDFLNIESEVAEAIARKMVATLPVSLQQDSYQHAGDQKVLNASAGVAKSRDAYLRGKFAWGSRGDLRGSITFFQQAIDADPTYAQAYSGLAAATAILGQVPNDALPPRDARPKAREAVQKALQLDPRLAEAHAVLGNVAMSYDWDLATAEKELGRAIELNPNDPTPHEWYAHLLVVEGRNTEALAQARHAVDLDPVSPFFHSVLVEIYCYSRAYDAAIEEAQEVVKLHPDSLYARYWLGYAYREKKMYAQAVQTFEQARQLSGDNPGMLAVYGNAQALAGNAQEARKVLHKLEQLRDSRFIPSYYLAAVNLGLGDLDETFRQLDLAYQERVDRLIYLKVEPMADPLRSDPRFAQLLAKIGLH
jgi:TolB-like protein/cytochrome c-type biogenesis protein CcmH/NrfG